MASFQLARKKNLNPNWAPAKLYTDEPFKITPLFEIARIIAAHHFVIAVWSIKQAESAAVKRCKATLAILAALSASVVLSDDITTIKGKEYKNATVTRVEPDGIVIKYKSGISKIYFTELPKEIQKRFGYDADKLRALEDKRIEQQNAADRERQEKQKNAEANLKLSLEQFQAAEQRAIQSYKSTTKGSLSGQVFVSTNGGENRKLGSVQVSLFARDAIDILLAGLKIYADVKIQELSPAVGATRAAMEQAHAQGGSEEWERYQAAAAKVGYYSTGSFYFSYFYAPIQTVETDAEGRFVMSVAKKGDFVIAAKAQRYIRQMLIFGTPTDVIEHYYWVQPVSLEGQQPGVQNLSNNNLTSTTGTSSLILTEDSDVE